MKIKTRIFATFMIVGFIFALFGVSLRYWMVKEDLTNQIYSKLSSSIENRATYVRHLLQSQEEDIGLIKEFITKTDIISDSGNALSEPSYITNLETIANLQSEIFEINILDLTGKIVVSNNESNIGLIRNQIYSKLESSGEYKELKVINLENTIPVFEYAFEISDEFENVIGSILIIMDMRIISPILEGRAGLGESGESFLVDENGYMISNSRFKDNVIQKQKIENENLTNCFSNKETKNPFVHIGHSPFAKYVSYSGREVIGTHAFIPETGWCLLVEIEEKEAMAPLTKLLIYSFLMLAFITTLIAIVAVYISRRISNPISELQKGINVVEKGNLDYKVSIQDDEEITDLANSFNEMTENIKKSRLMINEKVESQTKDIKKQRDELEKQRNAILNILEDIKDEKDNVNREKSRIEYLLESIGDGIIATNQKGEITVMNKSAENMLGWSLNEIKGKPIHKAIRMVDENGNDITDKYRPINVAINSGTKIKTPVSKANYYIRKNGTMFPAGITISPFIWDEEMIGTIEVFRDITAEKNVDKAKTEFVSLASHQLRTPLSAINWYTEMLLAGDAGELKEEQRKYLEEVMMSNARMIKLVDALLNVSRLELGTIQIDPELLSIKDVASEVIQELKPEIAKKKINFDSKFDDKIEKMSLDKKLAQILFQNLLTNAIKYTPEQGSISLSVSKNGNDVEIVVKDTGLGIPKEQQEKIFSKLFRADNVKGKDTDGTGLGLYLIKLILDKCNGSIDFESEEGKGTTFIIKIPVKGMSSQEGTKKLT